MREAIDTPCRYVSDNDKTASSPATKLDDLVPAGEVCALSDAISDSGAKVFEFSVPPFEVGHCQYTAIDLAGGKPIEETSVRQSRRSECCGRRGSPLRRGVFLPRSVNRWHRCRHANRSLSLSCLASFVMKNERMTFIVDRPCGQFPQKALTEQRIAFDRRHVGDHISYYVSPHPEFVQNESFTRLLRAVSQDVCTSSNEITVAHRSCSSKCKKHIGGDCYFTCPAIDDERQGDHTIDLNRHCVDTITLKFHLDGFSTGGLPFDHRGRRNRNQRSSFGRCQSINQSIQPRHQPGIAERAEMQLVR